MNLLQSNSPEFRQKLSPIKLRGGLAKILPALQIPKSCNDPFGHLHLLLSWKQAGRSHRSGMVGRRKVGCWLCWWLIAFRYGSNTSTSIALVDPFSDTEIFSATWLYSRALARGFESISSHRQYHSSPASLITSLTVLDFAHTPSFFSSIRHHTAFSTRFARLEILILSLARIWWIWRVSTNVWFHLRMMFRRVVFFLLAFIILFFSPQTSISTWCYATGGSFAVGEC